MSSILGQLFFNGIIAGATYALVASGFALIYSTGKFVNLAHGGVITLSAYFFYWLCTIVGFGFVSAVICTIFFSALLGYIINKLFYKPLREKKASSSILLVAGVGILMLLEAIVLITFGAEVKVLDVFKGNGSLSFGGAIITIWQLVIVAVSALLFVALFLLMKKTKIGKAIRAVSDNKDVAEILGISAEKIYTKAFLIGSAIAGVAAILISVEQNIEPTMGTNLIIKGFTGAVIGGVGSVPGAVLGAMLLGLVENFGIWYLPSGYKDAIAFGLLFLFLIFRPQGILGIKNKK